MKQGFWVAALVAAGATFARADEVVLTNGHTIKGAKKVDSKDPNKVAFDVGGGRIELDKAMVSSINPSPSIFDEYEKRWNAIKGSKKASDYADLARWARQNKLTQFVAPLCEQALKIEPDHEGCHKELGHEKIDGKWYPYEQAMEKKGFKLVGERWMTKAEIELMEKRRLEAKEREMAQKAERERQKQEERERRMREIEAYNDWYARQTADLDGYFYQPSEFWPAYFRPYPWASYTRSRRNYQYGGGGGYSGGGLGTPTFDLFRFLPATTGSPFLKK
jgi:hypothetical protein